MQLSKTWVAGTLNLLLIVLAMIFFGLMATSASAADVVVDDVVVEPILIGLFGAQPWIMWVGIALLAWKQLRPLMPARWFTWMPDWLLSLMNFLEDNWGNTKNHGWDDPKRLKQIQRQRRVSG